VTSRTGRFFRASLSYFAIVVVTLLVCDVVLIATGIFPPRYNHGDADLGWSEEGNGQVRQYGCREPASGEHLTYARNEDGIRTDLRVADIKRDTESTRIAVIGDSQTDLCARNRDTHPGILESLLQSQGKPAMVLAYGVGRYSPLQAYLAFRKVLRPYHPNVLVVNLYTGNDFLDILRVDDRPHFVRADSGYRIAPPEWFLYDDPGHQGRSRVWFAMRTFADRTGIRGLFLRIKQLRQMAAEQGLGLTQVFGYLSDLRKAAEPSLDYPDAFTAQWLNQQLYFRRFPASREESLHRIRALMEMARRENPGMLLVMSPLPSYQLTGEQPVDEPLRKTLQRVGVTVEEGVKTERELYDSLRQLASQQAWLFVDNLAALQSATKQERFFNKSDYHLLPPASLIIGHAESAVLADHVPGRPNRSRVPIRNANMLQTRDRPR
jgi:hypothetical protein